MPAARIDPTEPYPPRFCVSSDAMGVSNLDCVLSLSIFRRLARKSLRLLDFSPSRPETVWDFQFPSTHGCAPTVNQGCSLDHIFVHSGTIYCWVVFWQNLRAFSRGTCLDWPDVAHGGRDRVLEPPARPHARVGGSFAVWC